MTDISRQQLPEKSTDQQQQKNTRMRSSEEDGEDDEVDDRDEHPVFEFEVFEGRKSRLLHQPGAEHLGEVERKAQWAIVFKGS